MTKFPVIVKQPVQWSEMDAFGRVDHIYHFRYCEQARVNYIYTISESIGWKGAVLSMLLSRT